MNATGEQLQRIHEIGGLVLPAVVMTSDQVRELRRPFAVCGFMPQSKTPFNGKLRITAYLDSSLVGERLSDLDPAWTATFKRLGASFAEWKSEGYPTECYLTVFGVTRVDIGNGSQTEPIKGAYSDALKRAAWRFGIGSYLRDKGIEFELPQNVQDYEGKSHETFYMKQTQRGETPVLKVAGKAWLLAEYRRQMSRDRFKERYGAIVEFGDEDVPELDDAIAEDDAHGPTGKVTEAQALVLATLLCHGKQRMSFESQLAHAETVAAARYGNEIDRCVLAVSRKHQVTPEDRTLIIDAAKAVTDDAERALEVIAHVVEGLEP